MISLATVVDRQVPLSWHEAVAIAQTLAEALDSSGSAAVPHLENLALTPEGGLELLPGSAYSLPPVSAVARVLSALLPEEYPAKLRLVIAVPGSVASHKSLRELSNALSYFERPGRREIVREVHQRTQDMPGSAGHVQKTPAKPEPEQLSRTTRRRRVVGVALLALVVALFVLAVAGVPERLGPSALRRVQSVGSLASQARTLLTDVMIRVRNRVSRDLSGVMARIRSDSDPTSESEAEPPDVAVEAAPGREPGVANLAAEGLLAGAGLGSDSDPASESMAESPALAVEAVPGRESGVANLAAEGLLTGSAADGEAAATRADTDERRAPTPVDLAEGGASDAIVDDEIYDSTDVNVTPPVTLEMRMPPVAARAQSTDVFAVIEILVSKTGEVDRIRLLTPPNNMHESMILSALKTWRFRPALKNGRPVRFRYLLPLPASR